MKILNDLQDYYARYFERGYSDSVGIQARILLTQKFNAFRYIELFMFEDFLQTLPEYAQRCIECYCSNNKSLITTAALLNLETKEVRTILYEVELKMETFIGANTIKNIALASDEKDVIKALSHFKSNVLKHQVSKTLKRTY